ncbi:MAG: STAS domain-containing protein [Candidatus Nanopelagicales bacterium]|jgi:anti-anti-sigma factor|nr:STAS domain-containing protein [Candidatus Nanopelagicales bacterium]
MSLTFTVTTDADSPRAVLGGRIDREAAEVLDAAYRAAAAAAPGEVVLDFAGVDYINSTGIALIVGVLGAARAADRRIAAAGLSAHYQHVFAITRLSDFITVLDPVD